MVVDLTFFRALDAVSYEILRSQNVHATLINLISAELTNAARERRGLSAVCWSTLIIEV